MERLIDGLFAFPQVDPSAPRPAGLTDLSPATTLELHAWSGKSLRVHGSTKLLYHGTLAFGF